MDCRTAEGLVNRYIEHELPVNELEEFLEHVQNCPSCYEELETYFIVHEVTQQLDDNSSASVLHFEQSFLWPAGSYKFRRKAYRGSVWFSEYSFPDDRRRKASVSDRGI